MDEEFSDFKVVIKFLRITQDQESLKLLLEHGLLLLSIEDDAKSLGSCSRGQTNPVSTTCQTSRSVNDVLGP